MSKHKRFSLEEAVALVTDDTFEGFDTEKTNEVAHTTDESFDDDGADFNVFSPLPEPEKVCDEAFSLIEDVNDLFEKPYPSVFDVKNDKSLQIPIKEMNKSSLRNLDSDSEMSSNDDNVTGDDEDYDPKFSSTDDEDEDEAAPVTCASKEASFNGDKTMQK